MPSFFDLSAERQTWVHYLVSFCIGSIVGVLLALAVSVMLVEITFTPFFAAYFGLLFILLAVLLFWRIRNSDHAKPGVLLVFSCIILFSGILCFILERDFTSFNWILKIPLYSILGVSVTFALLFTVIDVMNLCYGQINTCMNRPDKGPLIGSDRQVKLVVISAITAGVLFGFVFGALDIEDKLLGPRGATVWREDNIFTLWPGFVLGGIVGCWNQYLGSQVETYSPISSFQNDDDDLPDEEDTL